MNNLYEALEICLQDIEQGADLETVLFRYPDLADELRPILEAAAGARNMAVPSPSMDVVRRSRAKVLQHAVQMREAKVRPARQIWFASLRRLAVTLIVVAALFVSGTSLVRAASTTLPGDNLYPVKRTWEDVLLLFTFNGQEREALEIEHENERLHELTELFAEGRSAEVDFQGLVTSQSGTEWVVSGVPVMISAQTEVRDGPIGVGGVVRVRGMAQANGIVLAERIRLLPSDAILPDTAEEPELEGENNNEGPNLENEDNSGPGPGVESPNVEESRTPETELEPMDESFEGVIVSMDNNLLVVNGIVIDISAAEIVKGIPAIGIPVKIEGYYGANGVFIVTKIEFENDNPGIGTDNGVDNNSNDDNGGGGSNDNGSDDSNSNDNGDDSGGGDNSGPGGGGSGGDD